MISEIGMDVLARRIHYYQSTIDNDFLKAGQNYNKLGDSYILFFCLFTGIH